MKKVVLCLFLAAVSIFCLTQSIQAVCILANLEQEGVRDAVDPNVIDKVDNITEEEQSTSVDDETTDDEGGGPITRGGVGIDVVAAHLVGDSAIAAMELTAYYKEGTLTRLLNGLAIGHKEVSWENITAALRQSAEPALANVAGSNDPLDFIPKSRVITTTGQIILNDMTSAQRRDLLRLNSRDTLSIVVSGAEEQEAVIKSFTRQDAVRSMIAQRVIIITIVKETDLYALIQNDVRSIGVTARMNRLKASSIAAIKKG